MYALQDTMDLMRLLSDPTRVRLMALLAHDELTVAELTGVTQLGQSRVSTHLGRLREAGLVRDRRVGTSSYYSLNEGGMAPEAERLWLAMLESTNDAVLDQDRARAHQVLDARRLGMSWADSVAGHMERHYSPGRTWEATSRGLLGLCQLGDVLDVASGDGALAELIALRARSVTCLDKSENVIAAAQRRLAHLNHVSFVRGEMECLPFSAARFDAVLLMNCLTYAERSDDAIREAARVVKPGGLVVGVTLKEHEHRRAVESYSHVGMGFAPDKLSLQLEAAGLKVDRCEVTHREKRPPYFEVITFHGESVEA